ncbi:MAG: hypothetical protein EOP84_16645 [Verrucomicrobiaceae bacterium]|nr:MAG: hypothetical protein EOP84_16645 [Verrucomicrobiaceae bacterium]
MAAKIRKIGSAKTNLKKQATQKSSTPLPDGLTNETARPRFEVRDVPGVRPMRSRPYLAGKIIAKYGLAAGVTDAMVAELDEAYGKPNPIESAFRLKDAWHVARGYAGVAEDAVEPPREGMQTKLDKLKGMWAARDYRRALKLAASWPRLGSHKVAIQRGWAAISNTSMYGQLGEDAAALYNVGLAAVAARYGLETAKEVTP